MSHRVVISKQAKRELDEATERIAQHAPETALRWYWGFAKAINSLENHPTRCGLAIENSSTTKEIRELLYGRNRSYRALFTIRRDEVFILTIRHTAQQNLQAADLRLLGLD